MNSIKELQSAVRPTRLPGPRILRAHVFHPLRNGGFGDSSGNTVDGFNYVSCELPGPVANTDLVLETGYFIDSVVIHDTSNSAGFPNNYFNSSSFPGITTLSNDHSQGWDGDSKGKPASAGIYAWFAVIKMMDGEDRLLEGDVVLIR